MPIALNLLLVDFVVIAVGSGASMRADCLEEPRINP